MSSKSKPSGTNTTVQSSEPYSEQKPYLSNVMSQGQYLYDTYTPQYYPTSTYSPANNNQNQALSNMAYAAQNDLMPATATTVNSALMSGKYLNANPAQSYLTGFGVDNAGQSGPAYSNLSSLAAGNYGLTNAGTEQLRSQAYDVNLQANAATNKLKDAQNNNNIQGLSALDYVQGMNPYLANQANPALNYFSVYGTEGPAAQSQLGLANNNIAGNDQYNTMSQFAKNGAPAPGTGALSSYASGAHAAAGNPYLDAVSKSVLSRAVPQVQSQFINSGTLSSPEAARATAEGAASALAPFAYDQYQKDAQNQLSAANSLNQQALQGRELQQSAGNNALGALLGSQGLQNTAASSLADQTLRSRAQQQQAASDLASSLNTGLQTKASAGSAMGNLGLESRQLQQGAAKDLGDLYLRGFEGNREAASELGRQALEGSKNQASAAAALGSQTLAGRELQQNAFDTYSGNYNSSLDNMLRGLALAPETQQMQYAPWENMYNAGSTQQNIAQNDLDDLVNRWNYTQEMPYQKLNALQGAVSGNYGGTTTRTDPYYTNRASNALSGGLGGASLGNSLFGPTGGIFGGLAGLGLGIFSDRRVKDDIEPVGRLDNGLTVYSYRYLNDPPEMRRIGLMADEVEQVHPDAVSELMGIKMVDYARAVE